MHNLFVDTADGYETFYRPAACYLLLEHTVGFKARF